MVAVARQRCAACLSVTIVEADLATYELLPADLVVAHYTLQFVARPGNGSTPRRGRCCYGPLGSTWRWGRVPLACGFGVGRGLPPPGAGILSTLWRDAVWPRIRGVTVEVVGVAFGRIDSLTRARHWRGAVEVGVVGLLAGCEIRRRWRSVVALVLLVGVVGAVVLATAAGARRGSAALHRGSRGEPFGRCSAGSRLELHPHTRAAERRAPHPRCRGRRGLALLRSHAGACVDELVPTRPRLTARWATSSIGPA